LVGKKVENVIRSNCRGAILLVSKNQVNPFGQSGGYIIRLKSGSHLEKKILTIGSPFGYDNIIDDLTFRSGPHLKFFAID
jgi:hypothetical protein